MCLGSFTQNDHMRCRSHLLIYLVYRIEIMPSARGSGHGPTNEVITYAAEKVFSDPAYFVEREGRFTLRPHGSHDFIPHRACFLRAAGSLAILHLLTFGAFPLQFSPFLSLFILGGRSAFDVDMSFLPKVMEGSTLDYLREWVETPLSFPITPNSTLHTLFVEANIDVRFQSSNLHHG